MSELTADKQAHSSLYGSMDQQGLTESPISSPLSQVDKSSIAGDSPIVAIEHSVGHLVLRGQAEILGPALQSSRDLNLPTEALTSSGLGKDCLRWLSPNEWLLTLPLTSVFDAEEALRQKMGGHGAIVNVSGGQTLLELKGSKVTSVLKKSTSYDVDLVNFPVGKVVTTTFAQAQVCSGASLSIATSWLFVAVLQTTCGLGCVMRAPSSGFGSIARSHWAPRVLRVWCSVIAVASLISTINCRLFFCDPASKASSAGNFKYV